MSSSEPRCPMDAFKEPRQRDGVLPARLDGDVIPMILRHKDVKDAARDWQTYSSDAPFRVPIPSEEDMRAVRQLPIETNPPDHGEYRKIVDPFFRRPQQPEVAEKIENLISGLIDDAAAQEQVEIIYDFAIPLQSRALTHLLNVPETEAETWIKWGMHVFHAKADGETSASALDTYIHRQLDKAEAAEEPGDDFFSALTQAEYRGRKLTRDEMVGFANLTFAGGRDTIIQSVAFAIGHLAGHPEALAQLREDPKLAQTATEEIVRVLSPLTHIGRVCPVETDVHGVTVKAGERVSLCWASANMDEAVFEQPEEVRLDRKPNRHVGFGSGTHHCLGAPHARLIIRTLLRFLAEKLERIELVEARENLEQRADYQRVVGYEKLLVKFHKAEKMALG